MNSRSQYPIFRKVILLLDVRYGDGLDEGKVQEGLDLLMTLMSSSNERPVDGPVWEEFLLYEALPLVLMHLLAPQKNMIVLEGHLDETKAHIQLAAMDVISGMCYAPNTLRSTIVLDKEVTPPLFVAARFPKLCQKAVQVLTDKILLTNSMPLFDLRRISRFSEGLNRFKRGEFSLLCKALMPCVQDVVPMGPFRVTPVNPEWHEINNNNHVREL